MRAAVREGAREDRVRHTAGSRRVGVVERNVDPVAPREANRRGLLIEAGPIRGTGRIASRAHSSTAEALTVRVRRCTLGRDRARENGETARGAVLCRSRNVSALLARSRGALVEAQLAV